jgi:parallel beta-helix repeat protein
MISNSNCLRRNLIFSLSIFSGVFRGISLFTSSVCSTVGSSIRVNSSAKIKKAYFVFALFIMGFTANATNYYVSATGNDAASGTSPSTPWLSIAKVNSMTFKPGDQIMFNRGNTFYGTIIVSQSGTSSSPITYGAYGSGALPIITGFSSISSWKSDGGGIYEYTCSTCQPTLNMVSVNDTLQPMGRWPRITDANEGYLIVSSHNGNSSITSAQIAGAPSFVGGEVVIRKVQFVLDRERVNAQTSTTVSCTPFPQATIYTPANLYGFFFQNHVNTLKKQGDWCYDSVAKKIQMFGDPFNVKATTLSSLVNISYKSYICFNGISFQGSNSNTFNIVFCNHIQITGCDIGYSGINAICLSNNFSNYITVNNCTISNSNNNAIDANGATNLSLTGNNISNSGMVRGAGLSGGAGYIGINGIGSKSYVWHNQVINSGYCGIRFQGDSIVVRNNFIDNFSMTLDDGGGIYTYHDETHYGRIISGNIIMNGIGDRYGINSNLTNPYATNVHGIYLDLGSSNVVIDSNTVYNCAFDGLELSGTVNVQVLHNTFYNNGDYQAFITDGDGDVGYTPNVVFKHNILFSSRPDQGILDVDFFNTGTYKNMGIFDSNYYCRPIYEPTGIVTRGYKHGVDWLFPYSDGGIMYYRPTNDFYSLDTWKTLTGQEAHTVKTPISITQLIEPASSLIDTAVLFEYNSSTSSKTISLGNNKYIDVRNISYSGTLSLSPYSSIILIYVGQVTTANAVDSTDQIATVETIEEQTSTEKMILYPNPAHDLLNLQLISGSTGPVSINIYDMNGRVVQGMQTSKDQGNLYQSFNISGLARGVYNLQVLIGNNKKMTMRFVKQ